MYLQEHLPFFQPLGLHDQSLLKGLNLQDEFKFAGVVPL